METMTHPVCPSGKKCRASAHRPLKQLAAVAILAVFVAGCSSTDEDEVVLPADQLYNQGLALANAGKMSRAAAEFDKVDQQHPYSKYSRNSIIMSAYSNYASGRYDEAIISARRFVTLYPTNPDSAYALYIIGNSYFKQIPDVTRDQEMSEKALSAMNELIQRFPNSEYADDAQKKINITRDQLAGKEMEVGRYYLKQRNFIAAINRFKTVVQKYQTTRHVEEALARLTESYYSLGVISEAQTAAAVLGHNFPESRWYKDSYALLKQGGYSPNEDESSWISKTFSDFSVI